MTSDDQAFIDKLRAEVLVEVETLTAKTQELQVLCDKMSKSRSVIKRHAYRKAVVDLLSEAFALLRKCRRKASYLNARENGVSKGTALQRFLKDWD